MNTRNTTNPMPRTSWTERVDRLDLSLFDAIQSQTTTECRQVLLASQRAIAARCGTYTYLEIGSYLGGTIQPHFVDDRCLRIYSIDSRRHSSDDDRTPGCVIVYEENSTKGMLDKLARIDPGSIAKIVTFDGDASCLNANDIQPHPDLLFIDGEHTEAAIISDYRFCEQVVSEHGAILFHDFWITREAILNICAKLRRDGRPHTASLLGGWVFGIFFDPEVVAHDACLSHAVKAHTRVMATLEAKAWLKRRLPPFAVRRIRQLRQFARQVTGRASGEARP